MVGNWDDQTPFLTVIDSLDIYIYIYIYIYVCVCVCVCVYNDLLINWALR